MIARRLPVLVSAGVFAIAILALLGMSHSLASNRAKEIERTHYPTLEFLHTRLVFARHGLVVGWACTFDSRNSRPIHYTMLYMSLTGEIVSSEPKNLTADIIRKEAIPAIASP